MADNIEYAGFVPSERLDWGKLIGGLTTTIQGIGAAREAERQSLDKLQKDNSLILQNTELGKSQNLNQLILAGSNNGREMMMQWNKELKAGIIKPIEYRNRINNLMDSWSTFANTAKTFDQQMQETLKRQQPGEDGKIPGSALEEELNLRLAQLGDLRNKKTQVDPSSGAFMIGSLDNNGMFNPNSVIDVRSISKPGNMIDNRIYLDDILESQMKGWESAVIEKGTMTVTDALQNPAVQRARLDLANSVLSNPRSITGILTNNSTGNYDFYYDDNDLKSKIQDRVAKENELNKQLNKPALSGEALNKFIESEKNKFILLKQDDQGIYQPNITNTQYEEAKRVALDRIDARLEKKIELDEPQYHGGSTKSDNYAISTYVTSNQALNEGNFEKLDTEKYNFKQGVDENGKKYVLVTSRLYDEKTKSYIDNPKNQNRKRIYRADALAQYIKGMHPKSGETADGIYHSGKDDYFKLNQEYLEGAYTGDKKSQSNTSSKPKFN